MIHGIAIAAGVLLMSRDARQCWNGNLKTHLLQDKGSSRSERQHDLMAFLDPTSFNISRFAGRIRKLLAPCGHIASATA
jgi:hypothetical protein